MAGLSMALISDWTNGIFISGHTVIKIIPSIPRLSNMARELSCLTGGVVVNWIKNRFKLMQVNESLGLT
jgi:hypothetical protein